MVLALNDRVNLLMGHRHDGVGRVAIIPEEMAADLSRADRGIALHRIPALHSGKEVITMISADLYILYGFLGFICLLQVAIIVILVRQSFVIGSLSGQAQRPYPAGWQPGGQGWQPGRVIQNSEWPRVRCEFRHFRARFPQRVSSADFGRVTLKMVCCAPSRPPLVRAEELRLVALLIPPGRDF